MWVSSLSLFGRSLAKADHKDILEKLGREQTIDPNYQPFGNGHAAEKICEIIGKYERKEL